MAGHKHFHFLKFQKGGEQVNPVQRKACVDWFRFVRTSSTGTVSKMFEPFGSVWRRLNIIREYWCGYECRGKGQEGVEPISKH